MSSASSVIIDQEWITVVTVAPAAPLPLPAPDVSRLYCADVQAEADRRYSRPYRLTVVMRREIAAELDAEAAELREAIAYAMCTPSRSMLTG